MDLISVRPVVSPVCFQSRTIMHVSVRPSAIIAMSHQPFVQMSGLLPSLASIP